MIKQFLTYACLATLFTVAIGTAAHAETYPFLIKMGPTAAGRFAIANADGFYRSHAACHRPGLHCVAVQPGSTWESLFPNRTVRGVVMRLNRSNVALKYQDWILVPDNLRQMNFMAFSPFPQHTETHGKRVFKVALSKFAFAAYDEQGNQVFWGPASGGRYWCEDLNRSCNTAVGDYRIFRKKGEKCRSGTYPIASKGGAPMPYCMFYYKGFAIHGSTLVGYRNHSRGCVRLFYQDAKWLHERFMKLGTKVVVRQ